MGNKGGADRGVKIFYGVLAILWAIMLIALCCGYNPDKMTIGVAFLSTSILFAVSALGDYKEDSEE